MDKHSEFLKEAIALADANVASGSGGPFGAVVARDGAVVARAANTVTVGNDPTAHAEINAIREACRQLNTFDLSGCTIYCSCEPCPMCLSAIYWARITRVYYAATSADARDAGFDDALICDELAKPADARTVRFVQLLPADGKIPLQRWQQTENKTEY
jgi:tRNA(Arg) A34 adenosine deaminase TadA